jgi:hypothetical protein
MASRRRLFNFIWPLGLMAGLALTMLGGHWGWRLFGAINLVVLGELRILVNKDLFEEAAPTPPRGERP